MPTQLALRAEAAGIPRLAAASTAQNITGVAGPGDACAIATALLRWATQRNEAGATPIEAAATIRRALTVASGADSPVLADVAAHAAAIRVRLGVFADVVAIGGLVTRPTHIGFLAHERVGRVADDGVTGAAEGFEAIALA